MRPKVVLCGSYHRRPEHLRRLFRELEATGCRILSPITLDFTDPAQAFVATSSEAELSPADIERFHLRALRDADFVMLHAPDGYVGLSGAYEAGFARALGKPVFALEKPADPLLASCTRLMASVFEILETLELISF